MHYWYYGKSKRNTDETIIPITKKFYLEDGLDKDKKNTEQRIIIQIYCL